MKSQMDHDLCSLILKAVENRLLSCYPALLSETSNVPWTMDIKRSLVQLGKEFRSLGGKYNYETCASPHVPLGAAYPEWLYDVLWYREDGETKLQHLVEVPMVAEIEWAPEREWVDADFQKLLIARAAIKLWVFWVDRKEEIERQFQICTEQYAAYRGWGDDGTYLLIGFSERGHDCRILRS